MALGQHTKQEHLVACLECPHALWRTHGIGHAEGQRPNPLAFHTGETTCSSLQHKMSLLKKHLTYSFGLQIRKFIRWLQYEF